MAGWNPWHGCRKLSPGCSRCYVYRIDARHGRDSSVVTRTADFGLPLRRNRSGGYKIPAGETVYTCFSSDFFIEEADEWRPEAWRMMRQRDDLHFFLITKRIDRFREVFPDDWDDGYENVTLCCTVENQDRADFRLPFYREAPIRHKRIICEPLLEPVSLDSYLDGSIEQLLVGGESGPEARVCDYDWIVDLRRQCEAKGVSFRFRQTGALFRKAGRLYRIPRALQHLQARKAGLDYR